MIETPWYIDELQNALLNTDTVDPDFISDTAAEYAEACAAANERLRAIAPLLRRELRSEVIQLAEEDPNILELVATLDFPGREEWCGLLKMWNREPPPQLLLDIASQINETYAIEAPLQTLLKRHRLLPLAGASLAERIVTLRELATADPDTAVWQQDVETLEQARSKEIRSDMEETVKREDLPRLKELVAELQSPDWTTPPDSRTVNMAREFQQRLVDKTTLENIQQAIESLNTSYAELDVDTGREQRRRYDELLNSLRSPAPANITAPAEEALDWLIRQDASAEEQLVETTIAQIPDALATDPATALQLCKQANDQMAHSLHLSESVRQDMEQRIQPLQQEATTRIEKQQQFASACQRLTKAISKKSPPDKLKPLYNAVLSFEGLDFPADLMMRYRRSVSEHDKTQKAETRYRRLIIGSIAGSILAGVIFITLQLRGRQQAALAAEDLKAKIADGKLVDARKLIKSLPPRTQLHKLILDQKQVLADAEQTERIRSKEFQDTLELVRSSDPSKPNNEALKKANQLAANSTEKKALAAATKALQASVTSYKTERQAELTKELAGYQAELDTLASRTEAPTAAFDRQLEQLIENLRNVEVLEKDSFPELATQAQQMIRAADILKDLAESDRAKEKMELEQTKGQAAITDIIGDPVAYQAALKVFMKQFPDTTSQEDYSKTLNNTLLWKQVTGIIPWQTYYRNDAGPAPGTTAATFVAEKQQEYKQLVANHGPAPFAVNEMERTRFRLAVAARSNADTTSRLETLLSAPYITATWMVRMKNGLSYYHEKEFTKDDLEMVGTKFIVLYRETRDYQDDDPLKRALVSANDIAFIGQAPHAKLAARFLGLLSALTPEKWDATFLGMTTELLQEPNIDPVLKLKLLAELLATASAGSYPLAKAMAPQATKLATLRGTVLTADWFHPDDSEVSVARDQAKAALKSLPNIETIKQQAAETWKQLSAPVATNYQWNGRIILDRLAEPTVKFKSTSLPVSNGRLYILVPPSPKREGTFQLVGRWNDGQVTLDPATRQQLVGGIPVYFHPQSSTSDLPTP